MIVFELSARYDSASFYGKARVIETPTFYTLISYDTKILKVNRKTGALCFLCRFSDAYSATTCRHINEFLKQYTDAPRGLPKRELLKMAGINPKPPKKSTKGGARDE